MRVAGRIRDEDVEEVRRRSPLADVAGEYMQVKRAGRLFKALCPFHQEKTPSFSIDPVKNLYFCFGCSEGGDVIRLIEKLENVSFVEAIERLARRAGLELHYEQVSPSEQRAHKRRARLIDAHRAAVELYHRTFMGKEGTDARTYWKQRGFTKETAEGFRVGLAPAARDTLVRALHASGFTDDELVESGLAVRTDGGSLADRFRARLMFPIFEVTGDPVAFGARKLVESDRGPKYINSAESPIYKKAQTLYALHWAKGDVVKAGRALLVEGYTDVIACHQAGIREVVATCGTALGLEHLRSLQRFNPRQVVLSLDADEAGANAAERTYEQLIADAQRMGLLLKVVRMPPGDDPADSVQRDPDGFRALVETAIPLLEFVLRREADRYTLGDPETKARALGACLGLLVKTEHQGIRDEYIRKLSGWVGVDPNVVYVELDKIERTGAPPKAATGAVLKRSSAQARREKEAIKIALQHTPEVKDQLEELDPLVFSVPAYRAIWIALASGADPGSLGESLDPEARRAYTALSVDPPLGEVTERLVLDLFGRLKESALSRQIEELKARLQRVNPETNPPEYRSLFAQLVELERLKRSLSDEGERG